MVLTCREEPSLLSAIPKDFVSQKTDVVPTTAEKGEEFSYFMVQTLVLARGSPITLVRMLAKWDSLRFKLRRWMIT